MSVKYQILLRVCDKVESVHNAARPFNLSKLQTIKLCFYSIYKSIQNYDHKITIIGDQLSDELVDFFEFFDNLVLLNENLGSASNSLNKQIDIASGIPNNEWIYLCEDDYLHTPYSFEYLTEFIENKDKYLETSSKKKNFINKIIGNLKNKPIIIHTADYPDRYDPPWKRLSFLFLSKHCHWRQITNTTHTVMLQSSTFKKFEKSIRNSAIGPSDSKLSSKVYGRIHFANKALCLSPIHGLSTHMTDGVMTPLVDWNDVYRRNIAEMKKIGIWND